MKNIYMFVLVVLLAACKHPLEILGQGDIVELHGTQRTRADIGPTAKLFSTQGTNRHVELEPVFEFAPGERRDMLDAGGPVRWPVKVFNELAWQAERKVHCRQPGSRLNEALLEAVETADAQELMKVETTSPKLTDRYGERL